MSEGGKLRGIISGSSQTNRLTNSRTGRPGSIMEDWTGLIALSVTVLTNKIHIHTHTLTRSVSAGVTTVQHTIRTSCLPVSTQHKHAVDPIHCRNRMHFHLEIRRETTGLLPQYGSSTRSHATRTCDLPMIIRHPRCHSTRVKQVVAYMNSWKLLAAVISRFVGLNVRGLGVYDKNNYDPEPHEPMPPPLDSVILVSVDLSRTPADTARPLIVGLVHRTVCLSTIQLLLILAALTMKEWPG